MQNLQNIKVGLWYNINYRELNLQIWKVNFKSLIENSCPFQVKISFHHLKNLTSIFSSQQEKSYSMKAVLWKVRKYFSKSHLGIVDTILSGGIIQNIKQPLYWRWEILRHFQNGSKKVIHKFLDSSLGGQETGEENFWYRLVCSAVCRCWNIICSLDKKPICPGTNLKEYSGDSLVWLNGRRCEHPATSREPGPDSGCRPGRGRGRGCRWSSAEARWAGDFPRGLRGRGRRSGRRTSAEFWCHNGLAQGRRSTLAHPSQLRWQPVTDRES